MTPTSHTEAVTRLAQDIVTASWPGGDTSGFPDSVVAEILARHLIAAGYAKPISPEPGTRSCGCGTMSTPSIGPELIEQLRGGGRRRFVRTANATLMHKAADALQAVLDERSRAAAGHVDVEAALQRLTNAACREPGADIFAVVADAGLVRHGVTRGVMPDAATRAAISARGSRRS